MTAYSIPEIEYIKISTDDVITTSPGTESSIIDSDYGMWDLDVSN